MNSILETANDWRQCHLDHYGKRITQIQQKVDQVLYDEVTRMGKRFHSEGLFHRSQTLLDALKDYIYWFRWSSWCCLNLAPPLHLEAHGDAQRMAATLMVYSGPRIIDDSIDEHHQYKALRHTLLGEMSKQFPTMNYSTLRCQLVMLGTWVIFYGLGRLKRFASIEARDRTMRLFERIAPAAIIESLHDQPLTTDEHLALIKGKAVHYDRILYSNLLDPIKGTLRQEILHVVGNISALAQYLNDYADHKEDHLRGQSNLYSHSKNAKDFQNQCQKQLDKVWKNIEPLPEKIRFSLASILHETLTAVKDIDLKILFNDS